MLIGHLPHPWLLNNHLYSLPGRKQQAHQGSGLCLCSDFMAFYATIRNTVYSVGAHCAGLQGCGLPCRGLVLCPGEKRGFVTGPRAKQGVPDTVTGATAGQCGGHHGSWVPVNSRLGGRQEKDGHCSKKQSQSPDTFYIRTVLSAAPNPLGC